MPTVSRALSSAFLVCLASMAAVPAAAAESREIVLWPEGVPEPRLPAEPAESVEMGKDGISRRSNVSNPRLVVHDIPRTDPAQLRSAVVVIPGGGRGSCCWSSSSPIRSTVCR